MVYDLMDTGCAEDGEPSSTPEGIAVEQVSALSLLSNSLYWETHLPELAA
jgi:DNA-directed RNA polymerase specialized sigma24 family protein